MLPFVTNSALGGGVQVAAFVQDRTQQQGGGWLGQHLPNSRSSCSFMTLPSRAANVKASATACGLLVFASACCPPRPRSGRLQVTMHRRALQCLLLSGCSKVCFLNTAHRLVKQTLVLQFLCQNMYTVVSNKLCVCHTKPGIDTASTSCMHRSPTCAPPHTHKE